MIEAIVAHALSSTPILLVGFIAGMVVGAMGMMAAIGRIDDDA